MSWRTEGHYKGISEADAAWLREFDRDWDRKKRGRSHTDALDDAIHGTPKNSQSPIEEITSRAELESLLIQAGMRVARFTVPRLTQKGWMIHLTLTSGRYVRVCFKDVEAATQAYEAIEEFCQWFHRR